MDKAKRKKTGRRILSIALAVALMGLLQAIPGTERTVYAADDITVAIDNGSETLCDTDGDGYYEIGTADELYAFAAAVNGGNTGINGKLTKDIVVNESLEGSPRVWTPICRDKNNPYTGTFDGGGHTVKGLYYSNTYQDGIGLFGYSGGHLKNVGVIDSNFSGEDQVGGICGSVREGGTVTGCYNAGSVSGTESCIGGVCGYIDRNATVTKCYNKGSVNGKIGVGGVCGTVGPYATMTSCYNEGSVSGTRDEIGGICGLIQFGGTVTGCYNVGSVSGTNSGSICGKIEDSGTVANCYYPGDSETDSFSGTTCKTEADIKSGEVCWLLNGSKASDDSAWGQKIGVDMQPVLGGTRVYLYMVNDLPTYSNNRVNMTYNNGVYEIGTADELLWFAEMVNAGQTAINAKLTANIALNGIDWTIMDSFAGTFDGDGHTISGLNGHKAYTPNTHGFIRTLANGGVVKNLTFTEADIFNHEGSGAISAVIVYTNNGTVENCVVKSSLIQLGNYEALGVVVGVNAGTIRNCASISNTVKRRYTGEGNKAASVFVWSNGSDATIENCMVYDCTYTDASANYAFTQSNTGTITNCYYYESSETLSDAIKVGEIESKTADQFASGEVTYLLNGSTIKGDLAWGQTLGKDTYPVFKTEDNTVCKVPDQAVYSNHNQCGPTGFCTQCGGFQKPEIVNDEYRIENAGQLLWFAEYVNSGNKSANAKLTADIDMSNISWTTICETELYYRQYGSDDGYSGTFDGNGHVISNLKVTSSADAATSVGLFGTVSGTIKNLGIESFTLVDSGKDMRAGAIVGQLIKTGKVSNCYVKVADIQTGDNVAGGIAGCVYEGTVENCYAVNVTVNGASGRFGYVTGDVCADGNSADGTDRPGTVKNCYTDGSTLTSTQKGANSVVGGEVGVTADRFASGEVAYLLNGSKSTGTLAWYQTLSDNGTDNYPVLNSTHGTVYQIKKYDCPKDTEAEVLYSNTEGDIRGQEHTWEAGVCTYCESPCSHEWEDKGATCTCSICESVYQKELTIECTNGTFSEGELSFDCNTKVYTINTDKPVTISGTTTTETVVIAKDVNANITLNGVSIDVSATENACAFKIVDNSTGNVTITLADGSTNTLKSGDDCAGLQKNGANGTLTIEGAGTLEAISNSGGAGIGGGRQGAGTGIIINGGNVTAISQEYGAGIGGGFYGNGTGITIKGGTVTATSVSSGGAGIGGGSIGAGTGITIKGGTVTATGSYRGAGIGGGRGGAGTEIAINGGTVTATGAYYGAGIGGGYEGAGTGIIISGGSVKAIAGAKANAIGGGYGQDAVIPTLVDKTTSVYLFEIDNAGSAKIVINNVDYPNAHGTEAKIYAYLPAKSDADPNEISVGGEVAYYYYDTENGSWIKTCESGNHVDGNSDGYCDECNGISNGIGVNLVGHSVTLDDQVGMNFYMDLAPSVLADDTAYMEFTLPGKEPVMVDVKDIKNSFATIDGKKYYIFTCEVAAKEMADTITAKVVCSDGKGGTKESTGYTYSVRQYAEALINKDGASDEEKALAKAMLNYGAYAQKYFDPDVAAGELANVNYPYAEGELTVATSGLKRYAPQVSDEDDALNYAGSTLILESNIKVRHYLKLTDETASGNLSGLTLYEAPEGETVDGTYYFFEKEFVATKLGDMEEYTVEGIKFEYCPLSYVITLLAEKTEGTEYLYQDEANDMPLHNLMKALYLYHEATMDYKRSVAN